MSMTFKRSSTKLIIAVVLMLSLLLLGAAPMEAFADSGIEAPKNVQLEVQIAGTSGYITDLIASWDAVEGADSYYITFCKAQYTSWKDVGSAFRVYNFEEKDGRIFCSVKDYMYNVSNAGYGNVAVKVQAKSGVESSEAVRSESSVLLSELSLYFNDSTSRSYRVLTGSKIGDCIEAIINEDAKDSQRNFSFDENGNTLVRSTGDEWNTLICYMPNQQYYYGSMDEMLAAAYYVPATASSPLKKSDMLIPDYWTDCVVYRDTDLCPVTNSLHKWEIFFKDGDSKGSFEDDGKYHRRCADCGTELSRYFYVDQVEKVKFKESLFTYTGKAIKPKLTVITDDDDVLEEGVDYTVSYKNNINVGKAKAIITLTGVYEGTKELTFEIDEANMADTKITGLTSKKYTGKAIKPSPTVKLGTVKLKAGTDYDMIYANNVKAGTATIVFTGKGNLGGATIKTFKIEKATNTLSVSGKTANVKAADVKKATQTLAASKILSFKNKGQGTLTYTKSSGDNSITIDKKTGKVSLKKGLKKGTYKVKVKVKAAGDANHKSATKTVTFTVKVA